jgi:hypothetical protein
LVVLALAGQARAQEPSDAVDPAAADEEAAGAEPPAQAEEPVRGNLTVKLAEEPLSQEPVDLYVDGDKVGQLPWSGTLAEGEHIYLVRQGEYGTAPTRLLIAKEHETIYVPSLDVLCPELELFPRPGDAELVLNGVPLGNGSWRGRLPIGTHKLSASAEGYLPLERSIRVSADPLGTIRVWLEQDPSDPRWPKKPWAEPFIELSSTFLAGTRLGSEAEERCRADDCIDPNPSLGFAGGARGGLLFENRFAVELAAGALFLTTEQVRLLHDDNVSPSGTIEYELADKLRLRGCRNAPGCGDRAGQWWSSSAPSPCCC